MNGTLRVLFGRQSWRGRLKEIQLNWQIGSFCLRPVRHREETRPFTSALDGKSLSSQMLLRPIWNLRLVSSC